MDDIDDLRCEVRALNRIIEAGKDANENLTEALEKVWDLANTQDSLEEANDVLVEIESICTKVLR